MGGRAVHNHPPAAGGSDAVAAGEGQVTLSPQPHLLKFMTRSNREAAARASPSLPGTEGPTLPQGRRVLARPDPHSILPPRGRGRDPAAVRLGESIEHPLQRGVEAFGGVVRAAGDLATQVGDAIGPDFTAPGDR